MSNTVEVQIQLPLPLDVASTLMTLIVAAYPSAHVRPLSGSKHMCLVIDTEDRVPEGDLEDFLENFTPEMLDPDVGEALLTETGFSAPEWLAQFASQAMAEALGDAPNYLEMRFNGAESQPMVLTVARSEGQTPHELRLKAEDRAARAETKLWELGVDPDTI